MGAYRNYGAVLAGLRGLLPALLMLLATFPAASLGITETGAGNWSTTFNASDITGGAGSDFPNPHDSAANQAVLNITSFTATQWYVDVSKTETAGQTWSTNLRLYVLRTSNGTGTGSIGGPLNTEIGPLSSTAVNFFYGVRTRNNVNVRLRVYATVAAGAGTYATTVYYTVHY
jgi:hypothetical protein